jgi:hypothetical protein
MANKLVNVGLDQYLTGGRQVVVYPPQYKAGDLQYPFSKWSTDEIVNHSSRRNGCVARCCVFGRSAQVSQRREANSSLFYTWSWVQTSACI